MLEEFIAAATAAGAAVKRFLTRAEAAAFLQETEAGGTVAAASLPRDWVELLYGISVVGPEGAATAAAGISMARGAIAATGTLVLDVTDPAERKVSTLPPAHFVLLNASTVVADLASLAGDLGDLLSGEGPAYLSLTTGPSRTADIERVLTIGVHGPRELYVLLLENE